MGVFATGIPALIVTALIWIYLPDTPERAGFLTSPEENPPPRRDRT